VSRLACVGPRLLRPKMGDCLWSGSAMPMRRPIARLSASACRRSLSGKRRLVAPMVASIPGGASLPASAATSATLPATVAAPKMGPRDDRFPSAAFPQVPRPMASSIWLATSQSGSRDGQGPWPRGSPACPIRSFASCVAVAAARFWVCHEPATVWCCPEAIAMSISASAARTPYRLQERCSDAASPAARGPQGRERQPRQPSGLKPSRRLRLCS